MKNNSQEVLAARSGGLANPYLDSQFKLILDRDCTRMFLNSVLKLKVPIRELTIMNSESNDDSSAGRRVYFDIFCEDEEGNSFIVEMQNVWQRFLRNRLIFYTCRKMNEMGRNYPERFPVETIVSGRWDYDIKCVYTVCLLNDVDKDASEQKFRQDVVLQDMETGKSFSDKLRIVVINLELLDTKRYGAQDEYYEKFLHLLQTISRKMTTAEELISQIDASSCTEEEKAVLRRVVHVSDISAMTKEQYYRYEQELRDQLDWEATMATFEKEKIEAEQQGIEQGKAAGKAEGKAERDACWYNALKEQGLSEEQIRQIVETVGAEG